MRQFILILFALTVGAASAVCDTCKRVSFSFPLSPQAEVCTYFFYGSMLDSLTVVLDDEGQGSICFPNGYQGYAQAVVNHASLFEFIAGEDGLRVESGDKQPSAKNVFFPDSEENDFFFSMMKKKKENRQERGWIEAGMEMGISHTPKLMQALQEASIENAKEATQVAKEIESSPLYAARLIEINDFGESLFMAENQQNKEKIAYVKEYLSNRMDWEALYTSGQFWKMVHNYTLSMFNKEDFSRPLHETQQLYAGFIAPLLEKVDEPIRSAMLQSIINECEAFGWETAKTEVMEYVVDNNIMLDTSKPGIARIMQGYKARAGTPPPSPLPGRGSKTILVFYDPGCDNCERALQELEQNRARLEGQGYQIISISSEDEGANEAFREYGIMATPTFFVINENGVIDGRYTNLPQL